MLTINRLFQISASHKCVDRSLTEEENLNKFGPEAQGIYGHGHNFKVAFIFSGEVDDKTGMIMELSSVKERVNSTVCKKYDHQDLNALEPFTKVIPTEENIANVFFNQVQEVFQNETATPFACYVKSSNLKSATYYRTGVTESCYSFEFLYPVSVNTVCNLDIERTVVYPIKLKLVLNEYINYSDLERLVEKCQEKVLKNNGVADSLGSVAKEIFNMFGTDLNLSRVRVDTKDSFAEYLGNDETVLGQRGVFFAAHVLGKLRFTENEREKYFGKCRFQHGHDFKYEVAIKLKYNKNCLQQAETDLQKGIKNIVSIWDHKDLAREVDDFKDVNTTGEQIIQILSKKLEQCLEFELYRVRLWETDNNRFCFRPSL
jgi:6-pyruvoyl tetrahydropterin synthase/QueD family protein